MSNDVTKARFFKFSDPQPGRLRNSRIVQDPAFKPPEELRRLKQDFDSSPRPTNLAEVVAQHVRLAKYNFETFGYHVPMLHLFNRDWKLVDFMSGEFADQSERFVFWRHAAERAAYLRAYGLVWVCESWIRDMSKATEVPLRDLPIVGERLHVIGADAEDQRHVVTWEIHRESPDAKPTLEHPNESEKTTIYFVDPVVEAMKKAWHPG